MRVLVVEDHLQTGKLMARLLRLRGHEAEHATSAADALELCASREFDVVVCDIGLPDMSGWDLVGQLRLTCPGLTAIALSGYGQPADVQRSLDAGFVEHLVKPITLEGLDAAVLRAKPQP
jgi:two-component system CheB/CheR fusion protein